MSLSIRFDYALGVVALLVPGDTLTIIVPTYNEAANVIPLVSRLHSALGELAGRTRVLFIDDSPDDCTEQRVAVAANMFDGCLQVICHHRRPEERSDGLSGAVTTGISMATTNYVIVMDGDLQHPPELLPRMFKAAIGADVVVASRYIAGGSAEGLDGGIRHLISRSSTLLAKIVFPWALRRVSDPMTGYFLLRRDRVALGRLRPRGFKILLELLALHPKLQVVEVPLRFGVREQGESKGSLRQGIAFLCQLLLLRVRSVISTQ